ncbi:hypothetical protein ASG92_24945 [Arthrobacter sp. Soil736]|uniref:helicase associated domain-containing protein n=1 Tax=Arthrobacter sp. Soil736 TaxID=1736395 RepID=UPI0006FA1DE2|nr:hypothetical protein ASG92_24945 [Arthrobacter sp. Soil736]
MIPDWRKPSTKQADDEARWTQRLTEVAEYRAAGNDWPRHNKTNDPLERMLGVWLHVQRINDRAGKLEPAKKDQLDKVIPGWRQGRARRGANSRMIRQVVCLKGGQMNRWWEGRNRTDHEPRSTLCRGVL